MPYRIILAALLLTGCGTAAAAPGGVPGKPAKTPRPSATATAEPAPATAPQPMGPPGTWTQVFGDEFDGTSLDLTKWSASEGWTVNNVTCRSANTTIADGVATLKLSSTSEGAQIITDASGKVVGSHDYQAPVGSYAEARIWFPGDDATQPIYNWPAWWTNGDPWPAAGEHDVAEGYNGTLSVNYHSPSGSHNQGTVPGDWNNAFHTYGVHRKTTSADVYWDGVLIASYPTDDNGGPHWLRINVGRSTSRTPVVGDAGAVRVDWVRVWV